LPQRPLAHSLINTPSKQRQPLYNVKRYVQCIAYDIYFTHTIYPLNNVNSTLVYFVEIIEFLLRLYCLGRIRSPFNYQF
jgi:hypothetical protein